jgi:para-aminobenzoate synthetase/4-amino-4-deoxychorismate lyase
MRDSRSAARPPARFALFDNRLDARAGSLLLEDGVDRIACSRPQDVAATFALIEAAAAAGHAVAIDASYELGYWLEPAAGPGPRNAPAVRLEAHVFARTSRLDADAVTGWLTARALAGPSGLGGLVADLDGEAYCAAVERILRDIRDGVCYQANLTRRLALDWFGDPVALYAKLRAAQPVRHAVLLDSGTRLVLSLSPELFFSRTGDRVTCRPMKGTAARSARPDEDAALGRGLAASAKDRAENVMIVDLLRNDLGRVARTGSVRVERLFDVEAYPTVWQMTSTITAQAPRASLETLFRALFPCGSVTGAPKLKAMQVIAREERSPRGTYCGALGYLLPGGDCAFNVPIRTLVLDAAGSDDKEMPTPHSGRRFGRGVYGVGSGIVADSVPEAELAECRLKTAFLSRIDPGFGLIESMRLDPEDAQHFALLEAHLDRLANSAAHFGFRFDRDAVRAAALAHGAAHAHRGRCKTRLVLDHGGGVALASEPVGDPLVANATVLLSEIVLDSRDPLRRHKTTVRQDYDAGLRAALQRPGGFDALFANENGFVVEGGRSNLFARIDGVWRTPPLADGVLPGIMRARLLADRSLGAVERSITVADLERADALLATNAVRGAVRVRYGGRLDAAT